MKKSLFTETRIVSILKQADAGIPVKNICRQVGGACRGGALPTAGLLHTMPPVLNRSRRP